MRFSIRAFGAALVVGALAVSGRCDDLALDLTEGAAAQSHDSGSPVRHHPAGPDRGPALREPGAVLRGHAVPL